MQTLSYNSVFDCVSLQDTLPSTTGAEELFKSL